MVDKVAVTIHVTPEERQQIEELAHERGYDDAEAYVLALIQDAAQKPDEDIDLETKEGIAEGLRQSLAEMKAGLGRPISELWDELGNDD
jgi:hypothetical protein